MLAKLLSYTILAVLLSGQSTLAQSLGPTGTLTMSNINISPDGFTRPVVAVNGLHPGPLVKGNKGQNFQITVKNNLNNPTMLRQTSVHWHGIFQHGSAWADGPDGVTQCPIAQNGDQFVYKFTGGPNEAGTFWYHSHFGSQYCDGLRGPLVIYDPQDPHKALYDVDDESTIITLADWYHLQAPSIQGPALSHATLINGKGRRPGGPQTDVAIVNVVKDKRYRLRVLSLSCDPNYTFSIDGHKLTVIETDGQLTQPLTVDKVQIFAGQRYSFVLNANQPIGNYWIRSVPNIGKNNLPNFSSGGINSAILRYATAPNANPTSNPNPNPVLLQEHLLKALLNPAAPGGSAPADIRLNFNIGTNADETAFTMNGVSWTHPDSPLMVQMMNGVPPQDLVPGGALIQLPKNKVVEVSVPGFDFAGPHPMHLHGHAFSVVRSAGSSTYNYVNPVRRDVVDIGGAGNNVTIRFRTDNPGPWFFHCHIEFHVVAGFGMVFIEAPSEITPPPSDWNNLCPKYDSLPPSATSVQIVPTPAD